MSLPLDAAALRVAREVLASRLLETRSIAEEKLASAEAQYLEAATSLRETRAAYDAIVRELQRRVAFQQQTIDAMSSVIDRQRTAIETHIERVADQGKDA